MRSLLLTLALVASGCASPCENINAAQGDAVMQTCVFSSVLGSNGTASFSPEDGAPVAFAITEREPLAEAFPDGSSLAGGAWVAPDETAPARPDSARQVSASALAPEAGRYALSERWGGTVRVRSAAGEPLATVRVAEGEDAAAARMGLTGQPNRATHLVFSPDGAVLFGADTQGHVLAWDAASGEVRWEGTAALGHGGEDGRAVTPDGVRELVLSADGARLAAATARGVSVWDAASGESLATWTIPKGKTSVTGLRFAPGGQHIAVTKSGRYIPASTRYSSFDTNGRRVSTPERTTTQAVQNPPTVFLFAIP